jgi:hypothetical protein
VKQPSIILHYRISCPRLLTPLKVVDRRVAENLFLHYSLFAETSLLGQDWTGKVFLRNANPPPRLHGLGTPTGHTVTQRDIP